jgi:Xaa-Pro aminopeptidase
VTSPPDLARQLEARRARLARLRGHLGDARPGVAILSSRPQVRHLAGRIPGAGPAYLVVSPADAWLVCAAPSADEAQAQSRSPDAGVELVPSVGYRADAFVDPVAATVDALLDLVRRVAPRESVGIEAGSLPAAVAVGLGRQRLIDLTPVLRAWRLQRDDAEIEAIRHSVAVVERCLAAAAAIVQPGASELDLDQAMREALWRAVGHDAEPDWLIGSGPRSGLPEPRATDRRLGDGEPVLLDVYPTVAGHVADLTRTIVIGAGAAGWAEQHAAVAAALDAAASELRPGATGREVASVMRESLARDAGELAASMTHHAGHGLGILPWEEPWVGAGDQTPLAPGHVIALEPGLYRPDGGVRVEGMWLITDAGAERLDEAPQGPDPATLAGYNG